MNTYPLDLGQDINPGTVSFKISKFWKQTGASAARVISAFPQLEWKRRQTGIQTWVYILVQSIFFNKKQSNKVKDQRLHQQTHVIHTPAQVRSHSRTYGPGGGS